MRERPLSNVAGVPWRALWACTCLGAICAGPGTAAAGTLEVQVLDRDGAAVPEVAVYAVAVQAGAAAEAPAERVDDATAVRRATINQSGLAFEPHVLVVETGTEIEFPNGDDVRHHVYSFSRAKRFAMTIDSGTIHSEPLAFDVPGLVTLGCNIHDNMLAYVLVVDTPLFAKTGGDGSAALPLPDGRYEVHVWTPRLPDSALPEPVTVDLAEDGSLELAFRFERKLYPPHEHSDTSLHWPDY
jgi:plastocyanin